jgi:hypothetical protein
VSSYRQLAEECTKYLHIATLLMNLVIPTKLPSLFPDLEPLYESLASEYWHRLPFWRLISDPWPLLEPLMISDSDSELGPKLSPLCPFLNIDRDDFYVKRAIHLYTRSSLQSSSGLSSGSSGESVALSSSSSAVSLSPQMESLLAEIHDIASCTKKPLTRVKIWRLVYEMEQDRNSSVALKALETALEVFDQLQDMVQGAELGESYRDMKYEVLLELVKHKSKEILQEMQREKERLIRQDSNVIWKRIMNSERHCIVSKLTPYLGDITALLKIFFETVLEEVWVLQLNALRKTTGEAVGGGTTGVLSAYDLLDEPLLPVVTEYLKFIGQVAVKLYDIHSTVEAFNSSEEVKESKEKDQGSSANPLTSSLLQSVRHSQIGRLLADVDTPGSSSSSQTSAQTSSTSGSHSSSAVTSASTSAGELWGSISSAADNSIISPSSAEVRRREDVYRAFGIAALLATCTASCPSLLLINQLLAVGKGASNRSQRRLTARSKFRAVQAIRFLPDLSLLTQQQQGQNSEEQLRWLPLLRNADYLRSLRGFLFCLAELQELRIPCSEETLAYALQHDPNAYSAPPAASGVPVVQSSAVVPSAAASSERVVSLVNTWIHDEGHHSDVCELARDLLLISHCQEPQIWVKLLTHLLSRSFHRLAIHTTVLLCSSSSRSSSLPLLSLLLSDQYLAKLLTETFNRCHGDIADKLEQVRLSPGLTFSLSSLCSLF